MPRFCLATWKLASPVDRPGLAAEPIATLGTAAIALEIISDGEFFAVLFSTVDDVEQPRELECRIGFVNGTKACSVWRDRGFPLVDATIEHKGNSLRVTTPHFAAEPGAMQYEDLFISIDGIRLDEGADPKATLQSSYNQSQEAPDAVSPATIVCRRGIQWRAERSKVAYSKLAPGALRLDMTSSRSPNLRPLVTGPIDGAHMWSGTMALPEAPAILETGISRIDRADTFGVPAFRFENVEVVGFRIDLGGRREVADKLATLIEPLNFHLSEDSGYAAPDFQYRVANRTVLVELLRYGGMKLKSQDPPLTLMDYQSQHELVVRVLVGRVDDDTAQARNAATYVPAIFVDNPWSKIIGRDLQGFAKCMANFSAEQPDGTRILLRPDGRIYGGGDEVPLTAVTRISSAERILGNLTTGDKTLLDIELPSEVVGNDDGFQTIDPGLAMARFSLADTRWRQTDFDQAEFRRTFATDVLRQDSRGFRSVQVSPVKDRGLPKTWVFGAFSIDDDLQMATPSRPATLTFYSPESAPSGWQTFCELLRIAGRPMGRPMIFDPGNWYRLKFSMGLTIDNGLDWTDV